MISVVVGGGINGSASRQMRRAGLKVALFKRAILASATFVKLQQADPRRPALSRTLRIPAGERGAGGAGGAAGMAPHIARPMRFACRTDRTCARPGTIRAGLFL